MSTTAPIAPKIPATPSPATQKLPPPPISQMAPASAKMPVKQTESPSAAYIPKNSPIEQEKQARNVLKEGIKGLFAEGEKKPSAVETPKTPAAEAPVVAATPEKKVEAEAATPAPAAQDDVDAFAHIKAPDNLSDNAQAGWKALKAESTAKLREAEKKLADYEKQIATYKTATPAQSDEVERLRAEHKAALDKLSVYSLQDHPDYRRQYIEPKENALKEAGEVLGFYGDKANADVKAILAKSPRDFSAAVSELTKDMNDMDRTTVQTAMRNAYKANQEGQTALSKAGELRAALEAKQAAQQKAAFEKVTQTFGDLPGFMKPAVAPEGASPEQRAAVEAYNRELSDTRAVAEQNVFGKLTPEDAAMQGWEAAMFKKFVNVVHPRMNKAHETVVAERDALAAELAAIRGQKKTPDFSGAAAPANTGKPADWKTGLRDLYRK